MKPNHLVVLLLTTLLYSFSAMAEFELKSESTFEPEFNNRFNLNFGLNPSLGRSQDIKAITLSYAREWEKNFWVLAHYQLTGIKFRDLAENNPTATNVANADIEEEAERLNSIGLGLGHQSRYIATLLPFDLYEFTEAAITYSSFTEKIGSESFKGPGIKAKYTVLKPIGRYTHLGLSLDYNLISFKRAANNDEETSSQRGFSASWLTFGFDLTFFL